MPVLLNGTLMLSRADRRAGEAARVVEGHRRAVSGDDRAAAGPTTAKLAPARLLITAPDSSVMPRLPGEVPGRRAVVIERRAGEGDPSFPPIDRHPAVGVHAPGR